MVNKVSWGGHYQNKGHVQGGPKHGLSFGHAPYDALCIVTFLIDQVMIPCKK
jgi:hypothetical protein